MTNKFLIKINQSSFFRHVSILTYGTIVAQTITALSMPLLTRLYSPSDFGVLAVYTALVSTISSISCLRFHIAIPIPEEKFEAINIFVLAIVATCLSVLLCSISILTWPAEIASALGIAQLMSHFWLLPLGVGLVSLYNILLYWFTRERAYSLLMKARIARAVGGNTTQLSLGYLTPSPFGLLIGFLVFNCFGIASLVTRFVAEGVSQISQISLRSLKKSAVKYRRFPIVSTPEALFDNAGQHLPIIIISANASTAEAGYLAIANLLLMLPMGLIGTSIGQVYLAEASGKRNRGELRSFTTKIMLSTLKFGLPTILAIGVLVPALLPYILGGEWNRTSIVILWLLPYALLLLVCSPISVLLYVTNNQSLALWMQVVGVAIRVGGVLLATNVVGGYLVEFFAVSSAVYYLLYLLVILKVLRKEVE